MEEVFLGEITAQKILHPEYGPSQYSVKATSLLQRLGHGEHRRTFYDSTPSQGAKDTLERYGLKAECDAFGPQMPYWQGGQETDWKLVLALAKRYGRDIHCFGDRVYVKELMTMHKGEHIYEAPAEAAKAAPQSFPNSGIYRGYTVLHHCRDTA